MRNLLIINGKSLFLPFSNFGCEIPPHFALVCAGFERHANRRHNPLEPRFHQPPPDRDAPAHGPALRASRADERRDFRCRILLRRAPRKRQTRARDEAHINGIEGFWDYAKSRLSKFRGMNKRTFYLHLKECEFRFNHRHDEVYEILLELCRKKPIKLS